jgi:hypothetical protein
MARRKISPQDRVEVQMSSRGRELLLKHTLADPEYAERLRLVPGKQEYVGSYTLDDLEDVLGYVAAEANHTEDHTLRGDLDALYDRLSAVQQSYNDGLWQDGCV